MTNAAQAPDLPGVTIDWQAYPPVIGARDTALRTDTEAAARWLVAHRAAIEDVLLSRGVVTFRGFALETAEDFGTFMQAFEPHAAGYTGGASPRSVVSGNVMESTQAPPDREILLHQEMVYARDFPPRIAFFCEVPPKTGGETLVGDMRRFTREVDPALFAKIKQRGLRYVRRFRNANWNPGHPDLEVLQRSWNDAFGTDDMAQAQAKCEASGSECEWDEHGLAASFRTKGFEQHPITGEEVWFNAISAFDLNRVSVGERFAALYERHYGKEHPWPQGVTYADGEPISEEDIHSLYPLMADVTVAPRWERGDVHLLDNILTGHGRATFSGERKIRVMLLG